MTPAALFFIAIILGVIFAAVFFVLIPLFFQQKKPHFSCKPLNSNLDGRVELTPQLSEAFESISFADDTVKLVRAKGVTNVEFEIVMFTDEKKQGDILFVNFGDSDNVEVKCSLGQIKGVNVALRKVGNKKIKSKKIVGPELWLNLVLAVAQAGSVIAVVFILDYAVVVRYVMLHRHAAPATFMWAYVMSFLGVLAGVASFLLTQIFLNKPRREVK